MWSSCLDLLRQCVECSCWYIRLGSTVLTSTPLLHQRLYLYWPFGVSPPTQTAVQMRCRVICSQVSIKYLCMVWCLKCLGYSAGQEMSVLLLELKFHYAGHKSLWLGCVLRHGSSLSCPQKPVIGLCTTGEQIAPRPQILDAPWHPSNLTVYVCFPSDVFSPHVYQRKLFPVSLYLLHRQCFPSFSLIVVSILHKLWKSIFMLLSLFSSCSAQPVFPNALCVQHIPFVSPRH